MKAGVTNALQIMNAKWVHGSREKLGIFFETEVMGKVLRNIVFIFNRVDREINTACQKGTRSLIGCRGSFEDGWRTNIATSNGSRRPRRVW